MSQLRLLVLIAVASFAGVFCSELLCRSAAFRDAAGGLFGRGRLIAIADGRGIYEKDLENEDFSTASDLVVLENLRRAARHEPVEAAKVDREFSLLSPQFGEEEAFLQRVRSDGFSISSLRERIADQLRSLQWIEKQIMAEKERPKRNAGIFMKRSARSLRSPSGSAPRTCFLPPRPRPRRKLSNPSES